MSNYYLSHSAAELDESVEKVLSGQMYNERYTEGYTTGYSDGYNKGLEDGTPTSSTLTYAVTPIEDSSYGFSLNSANYWESGNKEVSSSFAICRVYFNLLTSTTVCFDCINYGESKYDYGLLGNIDTALVLSNVADPSVYHSFSNLQSADVQTVSYSMSAGTHFVDVKYIKDSSVNSNNDTLQFKVRFA